jgi:hypothetical protein
MIHTTLTQIASLVKTTYSLTLLIVVIPTTALLLFAAQHAAKKRKLDAFPIVALTEQGLSAKESWFREGLKTIEKGLTTCPGPFQVITGTGPQIVVPNRYASELRNHDDLSLGGAFREDFFGGYPGFEPFEKLFNGSHDGSLMPELVRTKLTQSLGLITNDLVDETTAAITEFFGDEEEWKSIPLKPLLTNTVVRLSSRIFLGLPLCRDKRWLEIAREYTMDAFNAARALRQIPSIIRPIMHWFMAPCIKLRKDYRDAQGIVLPEVERRKLAAQAAIAAGKRPLKTADSIGWMYELAREKRDDLNFVDSQLELAVGSIHTTTEAISAALFDCMLHPEIVQPLREEIIRVVGARGWSRQTLQDLKLMDSFLKENQRLHPNNYSKSLPSFSHLTIHAKTLH